MILRRRTDSKLQKGVSSLKVNIRNDLTMKRNLTPFVFTTKFYCIVMVLWHIFVQGKYLETYYQSLEVGTDKRSSDFWQYQPTISRGWERLTRYENVWSCSGICCGRCKMSLKLDAWICRAIRSLILTMNSTLDLQIPSLWQASYMRLTSNMYVVHLDEQHTNGLFARLGSPLHTALTRITLSSSKSC